MRTGLRNEGGPEPRGAETKGYERPGITHVALLVGSTAARVLMAERATRRSAVGHTLVTGLATWAVLGGTSLTREAATIDAQLAAGDLAGARVQVRHLVGRDTTGLDADEIAWACIESVAENTSDAVVAPLLWGGLLGVPGLLGYRAVSTLDALIGHPTPRYGRLSWAAARLDDLANWVPARVAAALTLAAAPFVRAAADGSPTDGSPTDGSAADGSASARAGWAAIRRYAPRHPSPTAASTESLLARYRTGTALCIASPGDSMHSRREVRGSVSQ